MKQIIAHGNVRDGVLTLTRRAEFERQLCSLSGPVVVRVERMTRTAAQNAYYWGVVVAMISEGTGNDPDVVHEALKSMFNPVRFTYLDKVGEFHETRIGGSTAVKSLDAFAEYLEACRMWAAQELGIVIPDPGENEGAR